MLNAEATVESIVDCVATVRDAGFRASLTGMDNPYGDGRASEHVAVLATVPLGEELLIKR